MILLATQCAKSSTERSTAVSRLKSSLSASPAVFVASSSAGREIPNSRPPSLLLLHDGQAGTFDFALLDAEKTEYVEYYEGLLRLLRTGGRAAVDNTLWNGDAMDSKNAREGTAAIRVFNREELGDERASLSLVSIGDDLTPACKRG